MTIIPAFLNLILWVIYISSAIFCASFIFPSLGGNWKELNFIGKIACITSGLCAIITVMILVNTTVLPA